MQKLKWATARLIFIIAALVAAATGNILGFLLSRLYSWYFFNDLNCFKYYRHFYAITACGWKMVSAWIRDPDYRNMFAIPLAAPPMMAPDLSCVCVRATWPQDTGACNGYAQCRPEVLSALGPRNESLPELRFVLLAILQLRAVS